MTTNALRSETAHGAATAYRYGAELVTFYSPQWWGLDSTQELEDYGHRQPEKMWARILDALESAGMSAFEMTFAPADWVSAERAFGSSELFGRELASRGMVLTGGFHLVQDWYPGQSTSGLTGAIEALATFLNGAGAPHVVLGLPIRRRLDIAEDSVDGQRLLAETGLVVQQLADRIQSENVSVAVHTEAHSILGSDYSIGRMLSETNPDNVNVCLDASHLVLAGADPVKTALKHADRVVLAHWKDASGSSPAHPELPAGMTMHELHLQNMCALGEGIVNWNGWAAAMGATPAAGLRLIEIDVSADPIGDLRRAREFVTTI